MIAGVSLATFASTMSVETERDIVLATETLIELACEGWSPPVRFNRRLSRALGRVAMRGSRGRAVAVSVEFARLVMRCSAEQRRETVIHECAHVIAVHRNRADDGHGPVWRSTMRELGIANPEAKLRRATADSETRAALQEHTARTRSAAVVCDCKTYQLTPRRAARALRPGTVCARCRRPFARVVAATIGAS